MALVGPPPLEVRFISRCALHRVIFAHGEKNQDISESLTETQWMPSSAGSCTGEAKLSSLKVSKSL